MTLTPRAFYYLPCGGYPEVSSLGLEKVALDAGPFSESFKNRSCGRPAMKCDHRRRGHLRHQFKI
jgi:hypothetical protein